MAFGAAFEAAGRVCNLAVGNLVASVVAPLAFGQRLAVAPFGAVLPVALPWSVLSVLLAR